MSWLDVVLVPVLGLNVLVLLYFLALNSISLLLFIVSLGAVSRAARRSFSPEDEEDERPLTTLPVSIIVPAHNEQRGIVETVRSLLAVNYREFEIVVVNDGSDDETLQRLLAAFDLTRLDRVYRRSIPTGPVRGIYGSLVHSRIVVVDKAHGGRSDALNAGINVCRYPLFCAVDAAAVIDDDALTRTVRPFLNHPEETVAAGGAVRVLNGCRVAHGRVSRVALSQRSLPVLQVVDRLRTSLSVYPGWSALRSLIALPSALSIYRKQKVVEIGGYGADRACGEIDLVLRLHRAMRERRRPYRVEFVPEPVGWARVPESAAVLRQRRTTRQRRLVQALWDHRDVLFNPRYGTLGLVKLPHTVLFEVLGPFVEVVAPLFVIASWLCGAVGLDFVLLFLCVAVLFGSLLSLAGVLLGELTSSRYPRWIDVARLILFGLVESCCYRPLIAWAKVRGAIEVMQEQRAWLRVKRLVLRAVGQLHVEPRPGR